MEKVQIEEIADELGMQSKELIKRVQLLYKDIKSPKSKVTPEVAQEIFDTIILGNNKKSTIKLSTFSSKNINLYFSSEKIDTLMLEKIASTYKQPTQKEFMIRSFNFSELSIVKLLVTGLINLDIEKYVELKYSSKELSDLIDNMNQILDDVDFENIDEKNPLEGFEDYVRAYKPEVVYVEGISYDDFEKYKNVFDVIAKLAKQGIFELGFINIDEDLKINTIKERLCHE